MQPIRDLAHVIAFVGIDGSGKTTQAQRLATWLTSCSVQSTYLAHDSLSGVKSILDTIALEDGYRDSLAMLGEGAMRLSSAVVKLRSLLSARPVFEAEGSFLVIDRYSYCQYAAAQATSASNEALLRRMFACFPAPALTLLIDVPPEEASRRILLRGIDADPIAFLRAFDRAYKSLPEASGFTVIDGNRPEERVAESVRTAILKRFPELREVGA